ncbi:MAG TPA: SgcJ/EcaC family oxidoreductase [Terriglobales bacterium]|nr:SgcJ/EcaC family oxidoreductase [Terriglobales bacterium]
MYRPYSSSVPGSGPFRDAESIIRERSQDFCTAFNTANYDQVAAIFAPDGVWMPPNHDLVQGAHAIERTMRRYGEGGYQDLRQETIRVEASGDMALEIGEYTISIRQPNGTTVADRGKYLKAWRRMGTWSIVADSWSSNLPADRNVAGKPLSDNNREPIMLPNVPKSA